jgi:ATP-binding cassette subfamily F protein uup
MTLNVLEEYLQNFPGSLLIVSHDRFFLDKLADHIFIFQGEGRVKDYVGKCSEWRQYVKDMRGSAEGETPKKKEKPVAETVKPKSSDGAKRKLTYKEQRELEQVEAEMEALNEEKFRLEEGLSSGTLSGDELTTASVRIGEVIGRLDELEMRWLELSV